MPFWHLQLPQLATFPAYQPGAENEELLNHKLLSLHYGGEPVPQALPFASTGAPQCMHRPASRASSHFSFLRLKVE